jgi:hypothetical protein
MKATKIDVRETLTAEAKARIRAILATHSCTHKYFAAQCGWSQHRQYEIMQGRRLEPGQLDTLRATIMRLFGEAL